jgi:hypothetical protein
MRLAGILGSSLSFFPVLLPLKDVAAFQVDGVVVMIACQSACKARARSCAEAPSCLNSAPVFDDAARLPVSWKRQKARTGCCLVELTISPDRKIGKLQT